MAVSLCPAKLLDLAWNVSSRHAFELSCYNDCIPSDKNMYVDRILCLHYVFGEVPHLFRAGTHPFLATFSLIRIASFVMRSAGESIDHIRALFAAQRMTTSPANGSSTSPSAASGTTSGSASATMPLVAAGTSAAAMPSPAMVAAARTAARLAIPLPPGDLASGGSYESMVRFWKVFVFLSGPLIHADHPVHLRGVLHVGLMFCVN